MQCRQLLILLPTILLPGCGGDNLPRSEAFPVVGRVLVNGKPASRAEITFHPLSSSGKQVSPFAIAGEDGTFRPSTHLANDGAPLGEYAVTVVWPKILKGVGGEEDRGPDQLRDRFRDPQRPAAKVTIAAGDNALPPIELKTH
jgi:hypothetical protein